MCEHFVEPMLKHDKQSLGLNRTLVQDCWELEAWVSAHVLVNRLCEVVRHAANFHHDWKVSLILKSSDESSNVVLRQLLRTPHPKQPTRILNSKRYILLHASLHKQIKQKVHAVNPVSVVTTLMLSLNLILNQNISHA